ncbi:AraC family transcriptional regulator [Bradyrhizobium sp. Tv2a-2]|uniref:helix-turn-helix domain-containing protein n=1 Tax=Bradyrhizobium sp. Tv2a-2 TaxID=113395 RepID=UPI0018DC5DFC|nr:AraC family transcriptional regulator [Bradyrhizobium sp. Tv2a-2]
MSWLVSRPFTSASVNSAFLFSTPEATNNLASALIIEFIGEAHVTKSGQVRWTCGDSVSPHALDAESPPGESGVGIIRAQFAGYVQFDTNTQNHLVFFQNSPLQRLDCRMADQRLQHETTKGSIAICPAGIDNSVETETTLDALLVAIKPTQLAVAAAEECELDVELKERLSGYDQRLLHLAQSLWRESDNGYPNGPLFWNDAASDFVGALLSDHTSSRPRACRASLGRATLLKIREYVLAHLADPIEVDELAALAGRSPFHFSRIFARSIGMTPYRYVVHLRLQQAIRRIREGRMGLAEIAADTGFADQSHLSRWVRRVHGVAPSQVA